MFKGIIAIAENRTIGIGNQLPWPKEKSDLKFFREKTWGGNLIFGRKTFQSLGTVWLQNRQIYVLTTFNQYGWDISEKDENTCTHIIKNDEKLSEKSDYWVCGGKMVYKAFMPKIEEFWVTYIRGNYEGNVKMDNFEDNFPYFELINSTNNYYTKRFWK